MDFKVTLEKVTTIKTIHRHYIDTVYLELVRYLKYIYCIDRATNYIHFKTIEDY